MIGNFRYTGINLSGWIQGVVTKEKSFCVSSKKYCFKDNIKPAHWVGYSTLISLDKYDLFKRTRKLGENHASVTGNTEE